MCQGGQYLEASGCQVTRDPIAVLSRQTCGVVADRFWSTKRYGRGEYCPAKAELGGYVCALRQRISGLGRSGERLFALGVPSEGVSSRSGIGGAGGW